MPILEIPDRSHLEHWLEEGKVVFELCGQCEGLHIRALQALDGAIDSRILVEHHGLLFSTGLEVRPMALLPLSADLGRLNMEFLNLKIFLDIVDDATPQLVIAGYLPLGAGLNREQFITFVTMTMESTRQLATECLQLDYLFPESTQIRQPGTSSAIH
ncbi:MAG: YbjN domain-containing protein [Parahaliea sp.]